MTPTGPVVMSGDLRADVVVLIPAAGRGERLGAGVPKALLSLGGASLLEHAVRRLAAAPSVAQIVVAAPAAEVDAVRRRLTGVAGPVPVVVVAGGVSRQESVAVALAAADPDLSLVLVHDAARPLVPAALVEAVAAAVRAGAPAVVPVLPVADTVKQVDGAGVVVATVDRSVLRTVQTPQGFRREVLLRAHRSDGPAGPGGAVTDDAGLVERLGLPVSTVPGAAEAMKVTRPVDLVVAEALLRSYEEVR